MKHFRLDCLPPAALVFLAAFGLRLPSLFVPYYNNDEITNAIFGRFIVNGELKLDYFLGNTYILTHYLYAALMAFSEDYDLFWVHLAHALWVGATSVALYYAARELTGREKGGAAAGFLYAFFSLAFYAKDFAASLSESFSLLPATLCAFFYFRGLHRKENSAFFLAGFFAGLSALFKMPSGIVALPVLAALFFGARPRVFFVSGFLFLAGFAVAVFLPFFFYGDMTSALTLAWGKVSLVGQKYVNAYEGLPFFYWFTKFLLRSGLIALAALPLWYFALASVKNLLIAHPLLKKEARVAILFLFLWLVCAWFATVLGKRVFFHYFVFLFPALCLLASFSLCARNFSWSHLFDMRMKRGSAGIVTIVGLASFCVFWSDSWLRWSSLEAKPQKLVSYLTQNTGPADRIYVWGLYPQLYYYSKRMPASTAIWADSLAGFSTGTSAMEYMRATGASLTLTQSVLRDFKASAPSARSIEPIGSGKLYAVDDKELLTLNEILDRIDSGSWKKLFQDFFRNPPVVFLDTSPSDIRQFSHYPLEKYDLLKKFIEDNYVYEKTLDNIIVYRLKPRHSVTPPNPLLD